MGLAGMIGEMVMRCDRDISGHAPRSLDAIRGHSEAAWRALAQLITALENRQGSGEGQSGAVDASMLKALRGGCLPKPMHG
jgi:methylmalonyl-CoA mutase